MIESRRAAAKLNLFLEVTGRRDDGFHDLETVMIRTQLCDVLTFERSDNGHLSLTLTDATTADPALRVPTDGSNLILKAAAAILAATNRSDGIRVVLDKKIPVQAGLGGGSSNAATTLRALNDLWGLKLPLSELHRIAATLGSDINFFVQDCAAAVCCGRGERVTPIPVAAPLTLVAVRPHSGNSTADVFSKLQIADQKARSEAVVHALRVGSADLLSSAIFNRLTTPACLINAEMAELMAQLQRLSQRNVFMSGSGSTCFVVCRDTADAVRVLTECRSLDVAFAERMMSDV